MRQRVWGEGKGDRKKIDEEDDDKGINGFCGQLAFVVHLGLKKAFVVHSHILI
jgi:hypothetical protein